MPVNMRRLGMTLLAAVTMLAVVWTFRALPATAASGSPTVSAVSPTSGPVGSGSSGQQPITREIANFPQNSESYGNNSITIDPVKVGDLVVLSMQLHTTGISITGITGGNTGSWQRAVSYNNTGTDTLHYEVWWGVATATGASAVNISYSGDVSQWAIELIADSFTTASTLPWGVVTSGGSSNPSSGSASWPSLTSSNLTDQLYWGASEEESSATSSPTPGFTSNNTSHGNCFLYNGGLAPSTAYAPTCGESPADVSTAVGVIFSAGSATGGGGGGGGGGTQVTITGTNFAAGDTVAFGSNAATGVTVNSATSITATAPAGNPQNVGGTVDVTVTGPGGTSPTSPADEFTYLVTSSTYSISLIASTTSPPVGGTVTLTAVANENIGPTPYGMSIVDASTGVILSHVGSGSSFTVNVSQSSAMTQRYVAEIDNAGGVNIQANSLPVIVTWSGTAPPAPTVSNVNPATGPASGGTSVTVTGTNFASGDTVSFGSTTATSVTVNSATSITATSPAGSGTVNVTVSGTGGTSATSSADQFTYTTAPAPTVSNVNPATGPVAGGTTVTIAGTNFASGDTVSFGSTAATGVTVNSATSITATSPAGSGTVNVTVTGAGGTSATSSADQFTYATAPIPTVSAVSPASGPVAGGTTVTITGTNFAAGDTVAFGSNAATGVTVNSATSITATSPAGNAQKAGGTVDVTVTGGGATSPTSPADEFTYLVTSGIYSITLAASTTSPSVGGTVTLTATANKDIGPTPYGMSIVDASTGVILSHVGSGSSFTVNVSQSSAMTQRYVAEIDNAGGVNIQANSAPVIVTWSGTAPPAPTVSNVNPATGPASGGTSVTVTGTNFASGDTVAFGSTAATSVTVNSATSITATSPAGSGTVDVTVTGAGGTSATSSADQFTYATAPAPTVSNVNPATGPASGGTSVTVTGTNFASGDTVAFGSNAATGVTVNSATSITATSPAGSGTVDVTVTGAGGTSATSSADQFTYATAPIPTVSAVSPVFGPVAGGTVVTVTGTNFAAGDTVSFGSTAATGVTVNSATSITATAPACNAQNVGGTIDVTVTGPGGTTATSPADEFTYLVTSGIYSITLAASTTSPSVGGTVTLTATANKDIGPTPYGMSIVDASTGVIVAHVGSGSSFTVNVSQSSAMTQRYVAEIDNAGGVNIQANSAPVIITWS